VYLKSVLIGAVVADVHGQHTAAVSETCGGDHEIKQQEYLVSMYVRTVVDKMFPPSSLQYLLLVD
jgi:hypothetical protein